MNKLIIAVTTLFLFGSSVASECEITINGNDMMQYDVNTINVSSSCTNFDIKLIHSGKLDKSIMGHNIVIVPTDSFDEIIGMISMDAGIDNGFLPSDDRVIAKTAMIGGGETTSTSFDPAKLEAGKEYTFFCSFPGHYGIMRGKLSI
tara:strand:- start:219 stop:659 length:441 start_codon:yes stop_codon:yes gene_type:complete